ncbi:MAG: hypothetical protein Q4E62_06660 [Sutterellaceae bacterium]|nr:hypothetical protein [Sutterellaceae bacterium]
MSCTVLSWLEVNVMTMTLVVCFGILSIVFTFALSVVALSHLACWKWTRKVVDKLDNLGLIGCLFVGACVLIFVIANVLTSRVC